MTERRDAHPGIFIALKRLVVAPFWVPRIKWSGMHLPSEEHDLSQVEDKFDLAERPESWLDWDAIQRVQNAALARRSPIFVLPLFPTLHKLG